MIKYSKKLVEDYVNGNDLGEYNIDELEDDLHFMIDVINYTNDKNIYRLTSYRLKGDYNLVKLLISKFKTDIDFACAVADCYLVKNNEISSLEQYDIILTMYDITSKKNVEDCNNYLMTANIKAMAKYIEIQSLINSLKTNNPHLMDLGMGFWFVVDEFNSNDNVMKFFAEKYIDIIFETGDVDLETMLHEQFDSFQAIESQGINTYILNFINNFDNSLYAYAVTHIDVLDKLKNKLSKIKINWEKYSNRVERNKFDFIIDYAENYVGEYFHECNIDLTKILAIAGKELGVFDKIKQYDHAGYYNDEVENIDKSCMGPLELMHYEHIKSMMIDVLAKRTFRSNVELDIISNDKDVIKQLALIRNNRKS